MRRLLYTLIFGVGLLAPSFAMAEAYGVYSDLPEAGESGWATATRQSFKDASDVYTVEHNLDGSHKSGITASEWKAVTSSVTYVSSTSFSVADTYEAQFTSGRKVYLDQATDVIGVVESTSTAAGETTVTLSDIVLYSDNTTPSTVTDPITSVSVSMVTPRSTPAASTFLALTDTPSSYTANSRLRVNSVGTAVEEYAVPCFRAEAVGGQAITTDTWMKVQLTDENFDLTSAFDATTNYRFQPLVAGYYKIDAMIRFDSYNSGDAIGARIYKNGATYSTAFVSPSTTVENITTVQISDRVYLNGSTDYIELWGYQGHGSSIAVKSGTTAMSGCLER
jgi:hypothetical protein